MNIIEFLSVFGLGAIVAALIQAWLHHKSYISKQNFQEKKEAFVGLLEAYHRAAVENTDEAAKNFAYWQMRCELVSSENVRDVIQKIVDTNNNKKERFIAHEELKHVLRKDLGIK